MKMIKRPDLTEEQKKKAVELWNLGYGAPKISQMIGAYSCPTARFLNSQGLKRDRKTMLELRKKNGLVFGGGSHDEKEKTYTVRSAKTNS